MVERRKIVTIVFSDVSGSTQLGERLDAEALRRTMQRYFEEMRSILERHGGTVEKFIGDAVMAAFGIPVAHEDDALRAVAASLEMRERLTELNAELARDRGVTLAVRTGINTGEVVAGDPNGGQFYASGDAVNVAARLEQAAQPGDILLGEQTYELIRNAASVDRLEPIALKGKVKSAPAYRLLSVIEGALPVARRLDTPFVGRHDELTRLQESVQRAFAQRTPTLTTILGPAGIGKTRLAAELIARMEGGASVLHGRCLSYGEGITFWPLEQMLSSLPERPARVADPRNAGSIEDTFFAYRKLFEALAQERPLVLVLEDIHWAESALLDLLEHVVEWIQDAALFVLCLARPELLDERSDWPGQLLRLDPLGDADAAILVGILGSAVNEDTRVRATEAAEGNPFFLEQLLVLAQEEKGELAIPQTIQAVLAARLDRLSPKERSVLEAAAVVGKEFWRSALLALLPGAEVSVYLQRLVRKQLVRPERSSLLGEDAFRFGHVLTREAAYAAIPKEKRATLHERFADWLEASESPYDELVGYHLHRAYNYRAELGSIDEEAAQLAERAGRILAKAGKRAHARHDHMAAASLLTRAIDVLPRHESLRLELIPFLADDFFWLGRFDDASALVTGAIEDAQKANNRALQWHIRLAQLQIDSLAKTKPITLREVEESAEEALEIFEQLADSRGQAKAAFLIAWARSGQFHNAAATQTLEAAVEHARAAGDQALEASSLGLLTGTLMEGPMPVRQVIDRIEGLLRSPPTRILEFVFSRQLARLYAAEGNFEKARDALLQATTLADEFGTDLDRASLAAGFAADVERQAENLDAAETMLRRGHEILERLGERAWRAAVDARLAENLAAQGRFDEARRFLRLSEETAVSDDVDAQVWVRLARAQLLLKEGDRVAAEQPAREAVLLLEGTDNLDMRAESLIVLAAILSSASRRNEAKSVADTARRISEQRGNVVLQRRAQRVFNEVAAQT